MGILFMIVLGAGAGFVATRLMGMELGIVPTISIGVIGAIVGGVLLRFIVSMMGVAANIVGAVFGAIVLLWIYKRFVQNGRG